MVKALPHEEHQFVEDMLRCRRARCKTHLAFLRETAGRPEHRLEALEELRMARDNFAAIRSGCGARVVAICEAVLDRLFAGHIGQANGPIRQASTGLRRTPDQLRRAFEHLAAEHGAWLARFPPRHLRRWREQFENDLTVEGAVWEGLCRRWLGHFVDSISPAEDRKGRGPDFACNSRGLDFLVETGCITIDAVTRSTGLCDLAEGGGFYGPGTARIVEVVERKVSQCKRHGSIPTVLFLGTLHLTAARGAMGERAARGLLVGDRLIACRIRGEGRQQSGARGPIHATKLHGAAFVTADGPTGAPIGTRHRHVAAVLMGDAGMFSERDPVAPPPFTGVLHPSATVPFDPLRGLPGVRFLRLVGDWSQGRFTAVPVRCCPADRARY